jgi:hypothetical protein
MMDTMQRLVLKEHDNLRKVAIAQRMAERSGGAKLPEKCPACGDYVCSCRCPGCKTCGGSGYIRVEKSPTEYRLDPCPNYRAKKIKQDIAGGRGRGGLTAQELATLDWNLVIPGISDGTKAMAFVKPAVARGWGMGIMLGKWGQAKTLLMKIAVAEFIRAGRSAHYVKLTTLMDDIRTAYDEKENKMTALVNKIREWQSLDLLCLDEIDKDAGTDWAETRLFDLVDERWVLAVREQALTLFASNYASADEIPGYLRSRIEDNRWAMMDKEGKPASFCVYLNGADGRKSMHEGRKY